MDKKGLGLLFFTCYVFFNMISAAPTETTTPLSIVVSSTEPTVTKGEGKENESTEAVPVIPNIYQMHVKSSISNRFARTTIVSKVKNAGAKSQEATFAVVLPETAFIAGFIMEVDNTNYTAYIKGKEEAKLDYDQAVASGLGAAHVAVSARDSNRFTVSVNIEPEKKAAFYLTYEQLLKREDGHYEQVINLHSGQPVKDLNVEVFITESRKITDLKAPPLRSGNEIGNDKAELDPRADIQMVNDTSAIVKFVPNVERQKQLAYILGTKEEEGFSGQFVVQYDVERDPEGGEVLIQDGYFIHFFAPSELKSLPKHVVFVLDTSGSMDGQRIDQLKEAMHKILEQLHSNDLFSLVEFNTNVKVWNLDSENSSIRFPRDNEACAWQSNKEESETSFAHYRFKEPYAANSNNIKIAKDAVSKLEATGGTDIYSALKVGLHLIELTKANSEIKRQAMVMFLTDGEPTIRETSGLEIIKKITNYNTGLRKSPMFALSFGEGADKEFLQKLSLKNSGFNKHIYEAADASLQLQHFYNQISSPLLSDVTFKYEPSVTSLTKTEFPIHFGGSELVVAGWYGNHDIESPIVNGRGQHGEVIFKPTVQKSISSTERLWAYLTIKELLEKKEASEKDHDELKKKALDLALKYSFVTPVSSLVVVKPNATSAVDTEKAVTGDQGLQVHHRFPTYGPVAPQLVGIPPPLPLPLPAAPAQFSGAAQSLIVGEGAGGAGGGGYNFASGPLPPSLPAVPETISGDIAEEPLPSLPPPTAPTFRPTYSTTVHYSFYPPEFTTPTCRPLLKPIVENPNLLGVLSWLNDILNEYGILKLPAGNYKLGLNETLSETVDCPKTPLGSAGHCKLLNSCKQVHSLLTSSDVFAKHFCVLKDQFAGVCCPDK